MEAFLCTVGIDEISASRGLDIKKSKTLSTADFMSST